MDAFQLGPFLIEPLKGSISDKEKSVTIEPKAMALLCELKTNQGEVVSQQTLFDAVWPNRIFSPSSLQRAIAIIRKALNESSQNPVYLFTHPKLGYRLEIPPEPQINSGLTEKLGKTKLSVLATLLTILIVSSLLVSKIVLKSKPIPTLTPITFGQAAESNPKFSPSGELVSFQNSVAPNSLFISQLNEPSSTEEIKFEGMVIDYVWRDSSLLVVTRSEKNVFSLIQQSGEKRQVQKLIFELPNWESIREIDIKNSSTLWFVGRLKDQNNDIIVQQDLVSNSYKKFLNIGHSIIHVSIASSPHGLYFQYFDGVTPQFGLISPNGNIERIEINTPDISNVNWLESAQSLLVSNQLSGELFRLQNRKLSPIDLPTQDVLTDISSSQDKLIATLTRQDMDITQWHQVENQNQSEASFLGNKLVDTKYADYQATYNTNQDLAYISNQHGKPQIFIRSNNKTNLVFANNQNVEFIPPIVWSPQGNLLAFVVQGKIFIHNISLKQTQSVELLDNVENIMSWSLGNSLMLKLDNGEYFELDLTNQQITPVDARDLIFVAKDVKGALVGISKDKLFWGERRRTNREDVVYAFFQNEHLIIHTRDAARNELQIVNNELETIYSAPLDSTCNHLTGVTLNNTNKIAWLCTQLEADDSEIVLIENLAF